MSAEIRHFPDVEADKDKERLEAVILSAMELVCAQEACNNAHRKLQQNLEMYTGLHWSRWDKWKPAA